MKPIPRPKTAKEMIYSQLKNAILGGEFDSDITMTETSLAESLQTSRTPVREAVNELVTEGLLIQKPRKGFTVRQIDLHEVEQIFYLRIAIEMRSVKVAIEHMTEKDLNELDQFIDQQEESISNNDRITYIELDQEFHIKLLRISHQNILEDIFKDLYNLTRLIGHAAISKEGRMEEVIKEHRDLLQALRSRHEEEAADLMKYHLEATLESVKKQANKLRNMKVDSRGGEFND